MPLYSRVTIQEDRKCARCGQVIPAGQEAVKDRGSMYKIKYAEGDRPKQIKRIPGKKTLYLHPVCPKKVK